MSDHGLAKALDTEHAASPVLRLRDAIGIEDNNIAGLQRQLDLRKLHILCDTEQRPVPVVPELDRVLRQSKPLQRFYQSLSLSTRNEIARHISAAKQEETRRRRSEQLAVRLMETMEAEIELPPVIRQVMAREPLAAKGWERMSRSHRRMHLLGIFYYRTWDSRMRRIEKAVAEMVEYADQRPSRRVSAS